ncbi:MAG TPA: hypothetical protein VKU01_32490 [Bryobacteraceae bacterium]|nr:hypothetical protein [Bryobacteraceae bacterium]
MKRMGQTMGEDASAEFEQVMEELESGRSDTDGDTSAASDALPA